MTLFKCLAAGLVALMAWAASPTKAAPITLTVIDPDRTAAIGSTERFSGTLTNLTGADLSTADLFLEVFNVFDPAHLLVVPLVGLVPTVIAAGATSAPIELLDAQLFTSAAVGSIYFADLLVQGLAGEISSMATIRLHVVSAAGSLWLVLLGVAALAWAGAGRRRRVLAGAAAACALAGASPAALAQSAPVTLITGVAGTATDDPQLLRVSLPVKNLGSAAAEQMELTAISLRGATRTAPAAFPQALGTLAAGGTVNVQAAFDRSALAAGQGTVMTVTGRYRIGVTTYGFVLNRPLTLPAAAPGRAELRRASVQAQTFEPRAFPLPRELPTKSANPNPPGPPVPASPPRVLFPVLSAGSALNFSGMQPPGSAVPSFSFGPGGRFTGVTGTPPDPNGASGGGVILTTVNTTAAISLDGGASFTNINPFCMFAYVNCDATGSWAGPDGAFGTADDTPPNIDGNLCCDQAVVYVPAIDRFVWLMQTWPSGWVDGRNRATNPAGSNRVRLVIVSPGNVRAWASGGASTWSFIDLTTGFFGLGANQWLDYPSLAVGQGFVYMSIDQVGTGLLVARLPLQQLAAGGTVTVDWTSPADGQMAYGSHLMQNTRGTMYWAGHNGTDKLRVYDMPESGNQYGWRDVAINSYSNADYSSNTPGGVNWLQGSSGWGLENVLGAVWRRPSVLVPPGGAAPPDELWFAWGAGRSGAARPQPYVEMVRLASDTYALQQQLHVWNAAHAFNYPVIDVNANNEIGINLGVGGPAMDAVTAAGFIGDFIVYVPQASACSGGRFGDWLGLRRSGNNDRLFGATGYRMGLGAGGACVADPTYNEFGRFCDVFPNDASCRVIIK